MATDQMERGGPEGTQAVDHQQKRSGRVLVCQGRRNQSGVDAMREGHRLLAQWVKQHDQAVDKFKTEMAQLADEWKAIDQRERERNARED
mgnify:CR=1 FL=1